MRVGTRSELSALPQFGFGQRPLTSRSEPSRGLRHFGQEASSCRARAAKGDCGDGDPVEGAVGLPVAGRVESDGLHASGLEARDGDRSSGSARSRRR